MSDSTMAATSAATPVGVISGPVCACGCGAPLRSRQRRFASGACRARFWDQLHPRINRGPVGPRQGTIKALILGYLADGAWHTEQEIADAIRAFSHSVGARISELRRDGHAIESDAKRGDWTRAHRYRLVGAARFQAEARALSLRESFDVTGPKGQ